MVFGARSRMAAGLALLLPLSAGCAAPAEEIWQPVAPQTGYDPAVRGEVANAPPPAGWAPPEGAAPYQQGRASYYADRLAGRATATGEPYDPRAFTAAHRTLPFGTIVDVARADGRHVRVRINDRGPYARGRIIDLSYRAAAEIGLVRAGVADVVLRVIWVPAAAAARRRDRDASDDARFSAWP